MIQFLWLAIVASPEVGDTDVVVRKALMGAHLTVGECPPSTAPALGTRVGMNHFIHQRRGRSVALSGLSGSKDSWTASHSRVFF